MTRTPYSPDSKAYDDYFIRQAGYGLPVFVGGIQRGRGLGSVLNAAGRMVIPLLKSAGGVALKEAVNAGAGFVGDLLAGQKPISALKKRGLRAGQRILQSLTSGASESQKRPAPPGRSSAPPRKRLKTPAHRRRPQTSAKKRQRDIFG